MVAIVNESLAREAFGDQDPIGRTIQCGLDTLDQMLIVGVAADIRTQGPASPVQSEIYMPYEQHPGPSTSLNIVARTTREDSLAMAETIRRRIASRNADVPVKAFTMEGTLETASETQRFRTVLLVSFAGVALVLALAGIYGVMSYVVNQRVPELGVRIALGAAPSSILGLVIRQGAVLALAGVVVGIALSLIAGRFLDGLLFGVTPYDPWTLATVTLAVAIAAHRGLPDPRPPRCARGPNGRAARRVANCARQAVAAASAGWQARGFAAPVRRRGKSGPPAMALRSGRGSGDHRAGARSFGCPGVLKGSGETAPRPLGPPPTPI